MDIGLIVEMPKDKTKKNGPSACSNGAIMLDLSYYNSCR